MRNCRKILASIAISVTLLMGATPVNAATRTFTESQQKNADYIAKIVSENWEEYGVLPSVAVAQAMVETCVGDYCRPNNLWGLHAGKRSYNSLEEGIYAYMKVINNGYYEGAPGTTNYATQIDIILDGGYCQPVGNYYRDAIWIIENYDLYLYDEAMFDKIKQEKKEAKKKKKTKEDSHNYITGEVELVSIFNINIPVHQKFNSVLQYDKVQYALPTFDFEDFLRWRLTKENIYE